MEKEPDVHFEVLCRLGKRIRTTKSHWDLITLRKHPEMQGLERQVILTLADPLAVRLSQEDDQVFLYYRRYQRHFVVVVCRHFNGQGFVITSYLTNRLKEGTAIWLK